ncbi:MAG TPA: cyclase family protein [Acidobacteriota bacterium]
MNNFIDLSHEIEAGLITYPGFPAPIISDYLERENSKSNYAEGVTFQIGRIEMIANTGTYLDVPFHRYAEGFDLSELPLKSIANLPAIVVRCPESDRAITPAAFKQVDVRGAAVLFHTGWDKHWRTPQYGGENPYLTEESCEHLIHAGAMLVGIDSCNIDDRKDLRRPAHSLLLKARIPIVEHLCNLHTVPDAGFRFFAIPPKIKNFGSFPVRAFALLP